jgi:pimeloyl-ACP methyl ester carboxylesterase
VRRVLLFRHGIVINRWFMEPMARYFRRLGYEVHNSSYPTTRKWIEDHARDLAEQMAGLQAGLERQGVPHEFYLVTHSMGGLVLRYALSHYPLPPVRRAVMVVPPNRGSATARFFRAFPPYRWVFGSKAGAQLSGERPGIFEACGVPKGIEIGVIAGDVRLKLYPVPLEEPHDGVVSASEAMLEGHPLKMLPYHHTLILFRRRMWEEAAGFLERGAFSEKA